MVSIPVSKNGKFSDSRLDQGAADDYTQDDCADSQPFNPAVGYHQQAVWQVFGQDAILGRRVGGGTESDDSVGKQRMNSEKHQAATEDLDCVADEHDPPFGHRVGKSADKGGQGHVRDCKESL